MKTTSLYEITVKTVGGYDWSGLFLMTPTVYDVDSAIILDIESLSDHDETNDEEDDEYAYHQVEQLKTIQQILNNVDDDFVNQYGVKNVKVAGVTIGTICAEAKQTYDAGRPAEVEAAPASHQEICHGQP